MNVPVHHVSGLGQLFYIMHAATMQWVGYHRCALVPSGQLNVVYVVIQISKFVCQVLVDLVRKAPRPFDRNRPRLIQLFDIVFVQLTEKRLNFLLRRFNLGRLVS